MFFPWMSEKQRPCQVTWQSCSQPQPLGAMAGPTSMCASGDSLLAQRPSPHQRPQQGAPRKAAGATVYALCRMREARHAQKLPIWGDSTAELPRTSGGRAQVLLASGCGVRAEAGGRQGSGTGGVIKTATFPVISLTILPFVAHKHRHVETQDSNKCCSMTERRFYGSGQHSGFHIHTYPLLTKRGRERGQMGLFPVIFPRLLPWLLFPGVGLQSHQHRC